MKSAHLFFYSLLLLVVLSCQDKSEGPADDPSEPNTYPFSAAPFPNTGIPGFQFPEDSNTINNWVADGDFDKIYQHAWGIWTGLTMETDQKIDGQALRVFETWPTPSEIVQAIHDEEQGKLGPINQISPGRSKLEQARQFGHAQTAGADLGPDTDIAVSVNYSSAATRFAFDQKIFKYTVLHQLVNDGNPRIPNFPDSAITTKPTFKVISADKLEDGRYFEFPVWPGPPSTAVGFPEGDWNTCVYVDLQNQASGDGSVDSLCQGRTDANTYNLNDFIHFSLTAADTAYINTEFGLNTVPGDHVILVCMHVGTREITRWTWQTFWWSANPDAPHAPSNQAIVDARPVQLQDAPRHYAMATAYQMVIPAQPETGGESKGQVLYAFNPYLEAGFTPNVFELNAVVQDGSTQIENNVGVRTNCMSCHILANFDPEQYQTVIYSGDQYIDMRSNIFDGRLTLDFAWSIQGNIDTTGMAAFLATQ